MMDFKILTNTDGDYRLWPGNRESPRGWREIEGPTTECLLRIREVWTRQQRTAEENAAARRARLTCGHGSFFDTSA